jgi:hypothetical protein
MMVAPVYLLLAESSPAEEGQMSGSDHEQAIRERAYELWEKAGRPAERDDEFWHQAREQIPHPPEPPKPEQSGS